MLNFSGNHRFCQDALGGSGKGDFWKAGFGFIEGTLTPFFLPVINDFGGFVEQFDAIDIGDPGFLLQLGLELLPGIVTRPEEIGGKRAGAVADHLIYRDRNVFV